MIQFAFVLFVSMSIDGTRFDSKMGFQTLELCEATKAGVALSAKQTAGVVLLSAQCRKNV